MNHYDDPPGTYVMVRCDGYGKIYDLQKYHSPGHPLVKYKPTPIIYWARHKDFL